MRRVLAAGRRDDALYVRGDEEPGSSGESEADSDPDYEETPKRRRAAAQQPPRRQPSRRIVNTGVASGGSVVDALFARLGLVATAMPAQKRTIDELTTDADSSEPESDRPPPSPPFSALCLPEALELGPKPGGPLPSADLRTAILRRFFALHLLAAREQRNSSCSSSVGGPEAVPPGPDAPPPPSRAPFADGAQGAPGLRGLPRRGFWRGASRRWLRASAPPPGAPCAPLSTLTSTRCSRARRRRRHGEPRGRALGL